MRSILFIISVFVCSLVNAQSTKTYVSGTMPDFTQTTYIHVELDMSAAQVCKMTYEKFLAVNKEPDEFVRNAILSSFITKASDKITKTDLILSSDKEHREGIILTIKPKTIEKSGNNVVDYIFTDLSKKKDNQCIYTVSAFGGGSGAPINHIKVGFEHSGSCIGGLLKDTVKEQGGVTNSNSMEVIGSYVKSLFKKKK